MYTLTVSYIDMEKENFEETFDNLDDAKAIGEHAHAGQDEPIIEAIQIIDEDGNVWCLEEENGLYSWA